MHCYNDLVSYRCISTEDYLYTYQSYYYDYTYPRDTLVCDGYSDCMAGTDEVGCGESLNGIIYVMFL